MSRCEVSNQASIENDTHAVTAIAPAANVGHTQDATAAAAAESTPNRRNGDSLAALVGVAIPGATSTHLSQEAAEASNANDGNFLPVQSKIAALNHSVISAAVAAAAASAVTTATAVFDNRDDALLQPPSGTASSILVIEHDSALHCTAATASGTAPLILPNGKLVDCKNTLRSYSNPVIANTIAPTDGLRFTPQTTNSSGQDATTTSKANDTFAPSFYERLFRTLGTSTVQITSRLSLGSLPVDHNKPPNGLASDESDISSNGDSNSERRSEEAMRRNEEDGVATTCPVAVPLSMPPSTIQTSPRIHYLMIEPSSDEESRMLVEASSSSNEPSARALCWRKKWMYCRWSIMVLALVVLSAVSLVYGRNKWQAKASNARATKIVKYINQVTMSGRLLLVDVSVGCNCTKPTVEELALQWIIHNDSLSRRIVPNSPARRFWFRQRYAMATLWTPWTRPAQFGFQHECDWPGTNCSSMSVDADGVVAHQERAVTHIELSGAKWSGRIVSDLGLLSTLNRFDVSDNEWTGSLPESIGLWTDLTFFNVSMCGLTGSLPFSIAQWGNLQSFDVSSNFLTGSLPSSMGITWTNLQSFAVGDNALTGSLPSTISNPLMCRSTP